jgi:hypothetical protein
MVRKSSMKVGVVLAFGLSFAAGIRAHATDDKTLNASDCQSPYPADNPSGTGLIRGPSGVYNNSGGFRFLDCPITRDNTTNTNGLAGLSVQVSNDPSGQILCYANSVDKMGNTVLSVSRSNTPGGTVLSWGSSLNSSANQGNYLIECQFPSGARVNQILWQEN